MLCDVTSCSPRGVSRQALRAPAVTGPMFSNRPWSWRCHSSFEMWPSSLAPEASAIARVLGGIPLTEVCDRREDLVGERGHAEGGGRGASVSGRLVAGVAACDAAAGGTLGALARLALHFHEMPRAAMGVEHGFASHRQAPRLHVTVGASLRVHDETVGM
jgi:hypothetical protein